MVKTIKVDKICKSILQKSMGLMFSKKRILLFTWKNEKKQPIHMFFVFFPIDLFYLNKNKEVIEIKKNVKPFTHYNPKKHCMFLIEAPFNQLTLKLKDQVNIKK
ncbi:MAG: DUF192 domain-containing protein [Nanoarchaeota archaeon]|nr:DUF192 domain-containing protein [Nanoarchaeota archaeon]